MPGANLLAEMAMQRKSIVVFLGLRMRREWEESISHSTLFCLFWSALRPNSHTRLFVEMEARGPWKSLELDTRTRGTGRSWGSIWFYWKILEERVGLSRWGAAGWEAVPVLWFFKATPRLTLFWACFGEAHLEAQCHICVQDVCTRKPLTEDQTSGQVSWQF